MAQKLEVSSAFLSAVENGKKKMPESWYTKLEELYSLDSPKINELKNAVLESRKTIELDIGSSSRESKQLAISFARQFNSLDEETSRQIYNILNKHKEDWPLNDYMVEPIVELLDIFSEIFDDFSYEIVSDDNGA